MSYSLSHVIDECVDEKIKVQTKARGATPGAKYEIYEGSWVALNTWIETVIAKQKV